MITEQEVQLAVDFLRDNAEDASKCKAERIYLEEYRKSLKAMLMSNYKSLPVSAQEREAYNSKEYKEHLVAIKIAVKADEKHRFMREAAKAKIEAWRSMNANMRAVTL